MCTALEDSQDRNKVSVREDETLLTEIKKNCGKNLLVYKFYQ